MRARCSICSAVFAVQRENDAPPRPSPVAAAAARTRMIPAATAPPAAPVPPQPPAATAAAGAPASKPEVVRSPGAAGAPAFAPSPATPPAAPPRPASFPPPAVPMASPRPAAPASPTVPRRRGRWRRRDRRRRRVPRCRRRLPLRPWHARPRRHPCRPRHRHHRRRRRPPCRARPRATATPAAAPCSAGGRHRVPAGESVPLAGSGAQGARRLARALISDMVVYHPAKRQDGLRDGNLKQLFEDEIKKSWEEYADQVGQEVAGSTPYFREALNEDLLGAVRPDLLSRAIFLGPQQDQTSPSRQSPLNRRGPNIALLKDLATSSEQFLQRLPEVRGDGRPPGRPDRRTPPTLLDLVLEQLLQVPVPQPLLPLSRVVDDHIRDRGPGPAGAP